jgi:aspartate/methionine/tyrosine aminotransferase
MIKAAGLYHAHDSVIDFATRREAVNLVDSLSNPLGEFSNMQKNIYDAPIIWDAVYYGNVYASGNHPKPQHHVMVGSYSKLTGLNGLRVGWIACYEISGYNIMKQLVAAEYCGISVASTKIIMDTVGTFTTDHWELFEQNAQNKLDYNRGEFSKLERFFGGIPVNKYGMFYYAPMDATCKKLFEKSGVIWSPGSQLGASDDFGRFNVGQDIQLVRKAVATVLKNDKI